MRYEESIGARRDFLSEKRNNFMALRGIKDPEERRDQANSFRKICSWEEYKKYLEEERKDIKAIIQYEERKNWWKLSPSEFFEAKCRFYEDSPDKTWDILSKKPYLTSVEMERLIDDSECSRYYTGVFYIDLRDFHLKWITDEQAIMLSESWALSIFMNKKILTPEQKKILKSKFS